MRSCLILFLIFLTHLAHCQFTATSNEGLLLQPTSCRFKAGDSLVWANPNYNDKNWPTFNGSLLKNKPLWQAQKGWFRYTFKWTKRFSDNIPRDLIIDQLGESDIFLDGKLLAHMAPKEVNNPATQFVFTHIPFNITFSPFDTNKHVVAIRYHFKKSDLYFANTIQEPFKIWIEPRQEALLNQRITGAWNTGINAVLAGIFAILSLLHFLFYRANPNQKVNKLLSWSSACFAIIFTLQPFDVFNDNLTQQSLLDLGQAICLHLGGGLLLAAVYTYLRHPKRWFFWLSISLLALSFMYQWIIGPPPEWLSMITALTIFINYIRVSWLGKRSGNLADKLPWNSLRFSLFTFIIFLLIVIINGILASVLEWEFANLVFLFILLLFIFLMLLSVPIGLSLSLVQDYTHTHESLRQNLDEVQKLSAQTLAQEQEKQHILATQNETLERQVNERTAELNQSFETLKATQNQLIQKEKMASLGELTAGIAHEIQNPLNFVNNFSEVSVDLLKEVQEEREKPKEKRDEDLESEILTDLTQNLQKITHHGQRASSIVRGMLAHSRNSSGQKQPTNLNALADEYLRLSYHGQRAARKLFNCQLITHFEADIPPLNLVAEDIGRVLLNLYNNAFYAVQQKEKTAADTYQPTIWVSTRLSDGTTDTKLPGHRVSTVELHIRDNGTGISPDIISKVFQPFFTTKPTGEGTGLGLSLSYDIITKGHNGSMEVASTEGEGAAFILKIPLTVW